MDGRTRIAIGILAALALDARAPGAERPEGAAAPAPPAKTDAAVEVGPDDSAPMLLQPTLGRPTFVAPGGSFTLVAHVGSASGAPAAYLISARPPVFRRPLILPENAEQLLVEGRPLAVQVPEDLPEQTYDLEVSLGVTRLAARHCVAVWRPRQPVRLLHVSHMRIGSLTAPDFDADLVEAINAWSPTLVVASGDYLDVAHPDPDAGWHRLVQMISHCESPWLMACGAHDDIRYYSRHVAASPIGAVDVGPLRGVAIYDHAGRPLDHDASQVAWIERALIAPGRAGVSFVVSGDARPRLLEYWQARGKLSETVAAAGLGLYLLGGATDNAHARYRDVLTAATPMLGLCTHASSPALVDGASGQTRFRVLDVADGRVRVVGDCPKDGGEPASLTTDAVTATVEPADSGGRAVVFARNSLSVAANDLGRRVVLTNPQRREPWCLGARLRQVRHIGEKTICWLSFDLPARSALQAVAGVDEPPMQPAISAHWTIPPRMDRQTVATVELTNCGRTTATVRPLLRIDDRTMPYGLVAPSAPAATAYTLELPPNKPVTLTICGADLPVGPGRQQLQLYLTGGPAWGPLVQDVVIGPSRATAQR